MLSPIIESKKKGYYINYTRVYDYAELFDTLKSMINVSILALDEEIDYTRDFKFPEHDVSNVLEFAKNLIPFEEAEYLDNMRELMLSKKDKIENQNH